MQDHNGQVVSRVSSDSANRTFAEALDNLKVKITVAYANTSEAKKQFYATFDEYCKSFAGMTLKADFDKHIAALIGEPVVYGYFGNQLVLSNLGDELLRVRKPFTPTFTTNKPTFYVGTDSQAYHVFVTFSSVAAVVTRVHYVGENVSGILNPESKNIVSVDVYTKDEYEAGDPYSQKKDTIFILIATAMSIYRYACIGAEEQQAD